MCIRVERLNSIIVSRQNHKAIASMSISSNEKKITEFESVPSVFISWQDTRKIRILAQYWMVDGVVYFQHAQIIPGTENEIKVDRKGWLQMYLLETFALWEEMNCPGSLFLRNCISSSCKSNPREIAWRFPNNNGGWQSSFLSASGFWI